MRLKRATRILQLYDFFILCILDACDLINELLSQLCGLNLVLQEYCSLNRANCENVLRIRVIIGKGNLPLLCLFPLELTLAGLNLKVIICKHKFDLCVQFFCELKIL